MQGLVAVAASLVMPSHTGSEAAQLILRWFHIIAGITWVGLLYFFNLVNVPFMKQVDAGMKPKIFQYLTLPALNWFRWSSLATVFLGFWYWGQFYVGPDAQRDGTSGGCDHRILPAALDRGVGHPVLDDQEDDSQWIRTRSRHDDSVHRSGMALCELHAHGTERQPRALDRRGWRLRHRDAVQRVGHHLAQQ